MMKTGRTTLEQRCAQAGFDQETSVPVIGVNDENTFQNLKRTRDIHAWHKEYIS